MGRTGHCVLGDARQLRDIIWIAPSASVTTAAGAALEDEGLDTNRAVCLMRAEGIAAEASRAVAAPRAEELAAHEPVHGVVRVLKPPFRGGSCPGDRRRNRPAVARRAQLPATMENSGSPPGMRETSLILSVSWAFFVSGRGGREVELQCLGREADAPSARSRPTGGRGS